MSEHDQAMETVLGYAGRRASRELLAATLVAPFAFQIATGDQRDRFHDIIGKEMLGALQLADRLMKLSQENPPK